MLLLRVADVEKDGVNVMNLATVLGRHSLEDAGSCGLWRLRKLLPLPRGRYWFRRDDDDDEDELESG